MVAGLDGSSCDADLRFRAFGLARLTPFDCAGSCEKTKQPLVLDEILVMTNLLPNKSPEPTAVGAVSSAIAVHVAGRRWLSFFR